MNLLYIKGTAQQCANYWYNRRWKSIHPPGDRWVRETPDKRCLINRGGEKADWWEESWIERRSRSKQKKRKRETQSRWWRQTERYKVWSASQGCIYYLTCLQRCTWTLFHNTLWQRLLYIVPGYQRSRCASVNWNPNLPLRSEASPRGDSFEEPNNKASRACWISRCIILWLSGKSKTLSSSMKYWSSSSLLCYTVTRSVARCCKACSAKLLLI